MPIAPIAKIAYISGRRVGDAKTSRLLKDVQRIEFRPQNLLISKGRGELAPRSAQDHRQKRATKRPSRHCPSGQGRLMNGGSLNCAMPIRADVLRDAPGTVRPVQKLCTQSSETDGDGARCTDANSRASVAMLNCAPSKKRKNK